MSNKPITLINNNNNNNNNNNRCQLLDPMKWQRPISVNTILMLLQFLSIWHEYLHDCKSDPKHKVLKVCDGHLTDTTADRMSFCAIRGAF